MRTLEQFEEWIRPLLHHTHYRDGWFWYLYQAQFGQRVTQEMKERGIAMREEYARSKC